MSLETDISADELEEWVRSILKIFYNQSMHMRLSPDVIHAEIQRANDEICAKMKSSFSSSQGT